MPSLLPLQNGFGRAVLTAAPLLLAGCGVLYNAMPSAGPLRGQVESATEDKQNKGVVILDVNEAVTKRLALQKKPRLFSEVLGDGEENTYQLTAGDVVEITVWEAPPASLFGGAVVDPRSNLSTSRAMSFPEQMVAEDGTVSVPFAGRIPAGGHLPRDVEEEITKRLRGKANQPQVLVRVVRNNGTAVTVVGEVASSVRMPLTPRRERLLDAIAAAGGVRQPVTRMTVQLTRGSAVHSLPLDTIIQDPQQNVLLKPGDVVTAVFHNRTFTVLGAMGKNEEIPFEAIGVSLAQALARAGGLVDSRADAQGVFLFRFEDRSVFEGQKVPLTADGKVPVVYRANLKDPATFFSAQRFPIQQGDVLYVSSSSAAELQKFLNLVSSVFYPAVVIRGLVVQ